MPKTSTSTLNPALVNLTKSIALAESGNGKMVPDYNAVGDNGTSKGAYQFNGDNFKTWATQYGYNPNDFSPTNQNKVAYARVSDLHSQGLTPAQIAAAWNAGETKAKDGSWQKNIGTTTINGKDIPYNTPEYVQKVNTIYKQIASVPTVTATDTQKPVVSAAPEQSGFQQVMSGAKDLAKGAEQELARPVVNAASAIQTGLDETLGRGINLALGKGNKPTVEDNALNSNSTKGQEVQTKMNAPAEGVSGNIGKAVGTVAPYLVGVGEEAGGAKVVGLIPKAAGWLAEHLPSLASNTAIGTAQTNSLKQGVEQGVAAEVGQTALNKVGSYIAAKGARVTKALTEALTPRLTGKGYVNTALKGAKLSEPSIFGRAGVDGDTAKNTQRAVQAVKNVAEALGKKTTDIIKSGSAQITKNFNRVNDAIGDYAQNVVKPFLQKSGVDYNFADLKGALDVVKPISDLKGAALKTYNETRQAILSAVANKVSPEVKGGTSLTALRGLPKTTKGFVAGKITSGDVDFWDARKIIDDIGNEATKGNIFGSPEHSGASRAWADLRAAYKNYLSDGFRYPGQMEQVNRANEFLQTQQAKGMDKTGWDITKFEQQFGLTQNPAASRDSEQWDTFMGNLEGLYQGRTNLSTGLNIERGKTAAQLWAKAHPTTIGIAKKTAATTATAVGLGAGYAGFEKVMGGLNGE